MAVRALANVWVRIIYRMWVNKTAYQTATFEAASGLMRPGNASPQSQAAPFFSCPVGPRSALRSPSPVAGSLCSNGDAEPVPVASFLPTGRLYHCRSCRSKCLPQPATAFPHSRGGSPAHKTTPSQGRAQASGRMDGGGWPGDARLGLDRCGRLAPPHGRQLRPLSPCFFLSAF